LRLLAVELEVGIDLDLHTSGEQIHRDGQRSRGDEGARLARTLVALAFVLGTRHERAPI
jgi:hypothetical protein